MGSTSMPKKHLDRLDPEWDFKYVKDVVRNGLCTNCGACIALCDKIKEGSEVAEVEECAVDCPTCIPTCPRSDLVKSELEWKTFGKIRNDETLGHYLEGYTARSIDSRVLEVCQDGGVTTSFLKFLLENDVVDGVITVRGKDLKAEGYLARNFEELMEGVGSKYNQCPSLVNLAKSITEDKLERIAFIGTPCQIQGIRSIQKTREYKIIGEKVKVIVGLFCMESYFNSLIDEVIIGTLNLKPEDITKIDIKGKYMNISIKGKEEVKRVPLKDVKKHIRDACHACLDFASELADISIGSVGSPNRWCTVLTRTKLGESLYKKAVKEGYIESKNLENIDAVQKISKKKQEINLHNISEILPGIHISGRSGMNLARLYRVYRWRRGRIEN